jgi:uncharacterized membrane protein
MDFDVVSDLNWLGVIVAALVYFGLGGIWYMPPVFGNAWMRAAGLNLEGEQPSPSIYLVPLISAVVTAVGLAMIARAMGTDGLGEGLSLGLVAGLAFPVSLVLTTATFEVNKPNPTMWFAITAGYHFVATVLAAIVVGVLN